MRSWAPRNSPVIDIGGSYLLDPPLGRPWSQPSDFIMARQGHLAGRGVRHRAAAGLFVSMQDVW